MAKSYTLADFDYALPAELIAQHPAHDRSGSRLLHVDGARLADLRFTDLPRLLHAGDLLVFNDTRVIHARVRGRKATGGAVEILIERITGPSSAGAQLRASHPPRAKRDHRRTHAPRPRASSSSRVRSPCPR